MGGSDEPSNLVELSVAEHAEAHKVLFEKFGRWQDKIAWQMLSGRIMPEEARKAASKEAMNEPETKERMRLATINSNKARVWTKEAKTKISKWNKKFHTGRKRTEETKKKMSVNSAHAMRGRKHTSETKKKMSLAHKGQIPWCKGIGLSEETRKKMKISQANRRIREATLSC